MQSAHACSTMYAVCVCFFPFHGGLCDTDASALLGCRLLSHILHSKLPMRSHSAITIVWPTTASCPSGYKLPSFADGKEISYPPGPYFLLKIHQLFNGSNIFTNVFSFLNFHSSSLSFPAKVQQV